MAFVLRAGFEFWLLQFPIFAYFLLILLNMVLTGQVPPTLLNRSKFGFICTYVLDYIKKEEFYISLNLLRTNSYVSLAYKNQLSVNQNILA